MTVRLLPSPDTTIRPLVMTLPPFMMLNPNMRSSILVYDRESDSGSPVTGYSLPSNLPVHSLCVGFPSLLTLSTVTFTLSPSTA